MASLNEIKNNDKFIDVGKEEKVESGEMTKEEWMEMYAKVEDWLKIPNFVPKPDQEFTAFTGMRLPEEIRGWTDANGKFHTYTMDEMVAMDLHEEMEDRDGYSHGGEEICPYCTWC